MRTLNLTADQLNALQNKLAFDDATLVGSSCNEYGKMIIVPFQEIVYMRRGEDIDELNDQPPGFGIVELTVNTTEGEQTYYLYDFVVIAAHEGHITL